MVHPPHLGPDHYPPSEGDGLDPALRTRSMTSQTWPLSYFREAKVCSADLLQRLLRRTDDPELQIDLTRQLADEARHIQLLSELILELGGPAGVEPEGISASPAPKGRHPLNDPGPPGSDTGSRGAGAAAVLRIC